LARGGRRRAVQTLGHRGQAGFDQGGADPLALVLGQHRDRAEHLYVDEPASGVQQASREHHVPHELAAAHGHEREAVVHPA
jgi:hypothetical protein